MGLQRELNLICSLPLHAGLQNKTGYSVGAHLALHQSKLLTD